MNPKTIEYLKYKNLICIKLLGKGVFSEQVILAEHEITKTQYAIKVLNHSNSQFKLIQSEIDILKSLSHPNIVKYFKAFFNDDKVYLVMEYIQGGEISSNLPQTQKEIHQFFTHLILAVQYLHQNNIIHCDLKLENILISNPNDFTSIKIIDFGLSFQFEVDQAKQKFIQSSSRQFGTPYYMAPELFNNAIYSKEIDIWSCGIILYILLFKGEHPFITKGDKLADIKQKLKNPIFQKLHSEVQQNEFQVYDLIKKMTKIEPEERYTASQVLQHPWITSKSQQVSLTAYEIRQAFATQDKFKNIICAMMLVKYTMTISTKISYYLKPQIKIKLPIRKPQTMHELVQQLLQTINSANTIDQLSVDISPSQPNSFNDLKSKTIACNKIEENKYSYETINQINKQLQKPNKFQLKTKMLQTKIQSMDSYRHLRSNQQKPFFQKRQSSCKLFPKICQNKKQINEFSSTEFSNNQTIVNQSIISARLNTINTIPTKKVDYPCKNFFTHQRKNSSILVKKQKQSQTNTHYKHESFQINSKNVINSIDQTLNQS